MDNRKKAAEADTDAEELMLANISTNNDDVTAKTIDVTANQVLNKMTKFAIFRNLLTVSFAFMLLFSAFHSFANLQSSLNKEDGLGTSGMAVVYAAMVLTSLFLTPFTMEHFSYKWIMVVSMSTYIIYVSTGFYPAWSTIIPASLILGMGAAHLWLAVQAYITDIAKRYAYITQTNVQDRVYLFLGIFYAFLYTGNIWGNLISSLVFQRKSVNTTSKDTLVLCGSNFCPYKEMNDSIITPPSRRQVYIYTGFCSGMCSLALLLMLLFLTDTSSGGQQIISICKKLRQVTVQIFTSRNQMLLTFATLLSGLGGGFTAGDFTSAYISCPYGIEKVGFVMITYGVSQSLFSVLFGKLNQYTGHVAIYIFGFIAQLSAYITLLLWSPKSSEYGVVYVLAALFGIGGAINSP
ncbi:protein unc-93 homolog A-like [Mercenaria mercenaria]|uniref:protein unc-93 homolog A-like n=1 Tax=Mercenaria mercenaria TaxID=6596 RepID=UPI00234E7FEC|nr:protein unc-93 homolog A-like [Mercenaria mercenaria]